jgi:hypothetical protein
MAAAEDRSGGGQSMPERSSERVRDFIQSHLDIATHSRFRPRDAGGERGTDHAFRACEIDGQRTRQTRRIHESFGGRVGEVMTRPILTRW